MKRFSEHILTGFGIGLGVGVMFLVTVLAQDWWRAYQYREFRELAEMADDGDAEIGELVSGRGNLIADTSVSDQDLMARVAGDWWGVTWDPENDLLYTFDWHGTVDGKDTIKFNYLNEDGGSWFKQEDGVWWIKRPFYHHQTEDFEETYRILYLSDDYIVYQNVLKSDGLPASGRYYIKCRTKSLVENLTALLQAKAQASAE